MGDATMHAHAPMTKPPHSPAPVTRRMSGSPAQLAQIEAYRAAPPTITPEGGVRFIDANSPPQKHDAPSPQAFPVSSVNPGHVFMGSQYPSVSAAQQSTQPYLQPPPPMQQMPMTHDNTGSTYATDKPGSFRTLVLVSILLIVVCASVGGYVLWRGSAPPMPREPQPVPSK